LGNGIVETVLGPKPERNPFKKLDYKISAFLVEKIQCGSPRFVMFRCLGCHKIISGRWPCKCGHNRLSPTVANTWNAFWVWVLKR
jgi:hypothetical protein